jgi:hypothetical protein
MAEKQFSCTIHRLSGVLEGKLIVSMTSIDETISLSSEQLITYTVPDENEGFMNIQMNAPTLITGGIAIVMVMLIALIIRRKSIPFEDDEEIEIHGPPITNGPPTTKIDMALQHQPVMENIQSSPVVPESGLPDGWSMEQWHHYGQQYLDRMGKQP